MGFIEITEEMVNKAFTENGGIGYKTTGSRCLDYFAVVGGMRYEPDTAINLFMLAYREDPILALKILFYLRDVRKGLGERNLFRYTINLLANMYPDVCKQLITYIPDLGRWDDLLSLIDTPIKEDVVNLIKNQLDKDIENKKEGKPISLLAKWMPSINTTSAESRALAIKLAKSFGMKAVDYRKMLSFLRKDLIIENNLRVKDYTFPYPQVPGGALFKYRNAFLENDYDRFQKYLTDVRNNKAKMNSSTVYPYQVIREFDDILYFGQDKSRAEIDTLNTIWDSFDRTNVQGKTIVVRDGSYSMFDSNAASAEAIATSLAMLFAERLTGEFKNKFITFSARPQLVTITGETAYEKYRSVVKYHEATTTNIEAVYNLILKVYQHKDFKKEDMLDRIVIISDMEFDEIDNYDDTSYNYFKSKFEKLGFELPEVVFWNVRCRNVQFPATMKDINLKLASGASPLVIDSITNTNSLTAYDYMLQVLEIYNYLNDITIQK